MTKNLEGNDSNHFQSVSISYNDKAKLRYD